MRTARSATACGSTGTYRSPIDDGLGAAGGRVPSRRRRALPGAAQLRALRQGAAVPGGLRLGLGRDGGATTRTWPPARPTSTRTGRWRIRRSGCRHGYACVRVDSRGTGRSPGVIDHFSAAGDPGPLRVHRVGRHPGVEHRQGRAERASPTTPSTSGTWRRCSRRTWSRWRRGRARPTSTGT